VERDPLVAVAEHCRSLDRLAGEVANVRADRDTAIETAFAVGYSINSIAAAAQLTPARVGRILGHPHGRPGRPRQGENSVTPPEESARYD
jgi:hypothetical protein